MNEHQQKQDKVHESQYEKANPVALRGEPLEETDSFTYPGSICNKSGGAEEDVKARIKKPELHSSF